MIYVPNLRFPEFEEEWEEIYLENICDKIGDGIHSTPEYSDSGDCFFINGNNLVDGKIKISELTKKVSRKEAEKYNSNNMLKNTLFISINGTIGNLALYNDEPVMLGKSVCYINPKSSQNTIFIFYQLCSKRVYNYFISELTGTTIKNLSLKSIRNTILCIPHQEEQTKIAHLLQLIDDRISTQSQIVGELETLILDLRKKVFSLFLGDFTVLGKVANIYQPQTISISECVNDGNYLVYGANGIIGKYYSYNHELSQICITCRGNTCGTVNYSQPKSHITGNSMVINVDKNIDWVNKRFLFHYLSSLNFTSIISGSGQPQIVRQPLANLKIIIPEMEQQNNIAIFLDLVQEKINQEKNILFAYQQQKKYLLKQMFT